MVWRFSGVATLSVDVTFLAEKAYKQTIDCLWFHLEGSGPVLVTCVMSSSSSSQLPPLTCSRTVSACFPAGPPSPCWPRLRRATRRWCIAAYRKPMSLALAWIKNIFMRSSSKSVAVIRKLLWLALWVLIWAQSLLLRTSLRLPWLRMISLDCSVPHSLPAVSFSLKTPWPLSLQDCVALLNTKILQLIFNTLCSVSSPVMTSIFSSKHFCDGLEEKAAADSIRDMFLIGSEFEATLGNFKRDLNDFSLAYERFWSGCWVSFWVP